MWICTGYQIVRSIEQFGWALIPPSIPDLRPVCTVSQTVLKTHPATVHYQLYHGSGIPTAVDLDLSSTRDP